MCCCGAGDGEETGPLDGDDEDEPDEELQAGKAAGSLHVELCGEVDSLRHDGELDAFGIRTSLAEDPSVAQQCGRSVSGTPVSVQATRVLEPALPLRCCDNVSCKRPLHLDSIRVGHTISERTSAGGRNWAPYIAMTLCSRCYNRIIGSGSIEFKPRGRKRTAAQADLSLKQGDDDSDDDTSLTWHPPTPSGGQGQRQLQTRQSTRTASGKSSISLSQHSTFAATEINITAEARTEGSGSLVSDSLRSLLSQYNDGTYLSRVVHTLLLPKRAGIDTSSCILMFDT